MIKLSYIEKLNEFTKLMSLSSGDNYAELSADFIKRISENKILNKSLFRITLFKDEDRQNIQKHEYKIVEGVNIIDALSSYLEEDIRFTLNLLEDN